MFTSSSSSILLRILDTDTVGSMWLYDTGTVQNGVLKLFTLSMNEQRIDAESKTHPLASRNSVFIPTRRHCWSVVQSRDRL